MFNKLPPIVTKLCVHTGNVLNIDELKQKPGQNPTEELIESLRITLNEWSPTAAPNNTKLDIYSRNEESKTTGPEERDELKISAKIFVTSGKAVALTEAIENLFTALGATSIDSLVLSYYNSAASTGNNDQETLNELWSILEQTVEKNKVLRIGVSDVDPDVFIALYQKAKVKPSIVQINLSTCCVVPPQLQEFTKQNDVQLLTHNDPQEFLPDAALDSVFKPMVGEGEQPFRLYWTARFLVHVKCRGVLASKGYLVCAHRASPA